MDTLKKLLARIDLDLAHLAELQKKRLEYDQLLARVDLELAHSAELQKKPSPQPK